MKLFFLVFCVCFNSFGYFVKSARSITPASLDLQKKSDISGKWKGNIIITSPDRKTIPMEINFISPWNELSVDDIIVNSKKFDAPFLKYVDNQLKITVSGEIPELNNGKHVYLRLAGSGYNDHAAKGSTLQGSVAVFEKKNTKEKPVQIGSGIFLFHYSN